MTAITYRSTTTGLYPLPDGAKDNLLALKGRQRDDLIDGSEGPDIVAVYRDAEEQVLEWQRDADIDRIVDGQLRWDDMLAHPLAVHDAVETGGLRRYYDNNNFYREMRITGPLSPTGDLAADVGRIGSAADAGQTQAVLPGPVSLVDLATDDHYGDDDAFLDAVTDLLAGEIDLLPDVGTCLILEPAISDGRLPVESESAIDAIERVVDAAIDDGIDDPIVHVPWDAPSEPVYRALHDGGAAGFGFDVVNAADEITDLLGAVGAPATVALGVVDGQNTRVETPDEIASAATDLLDRTDDVSTAYLTLNTEGFYLPTNRFREKLGALGVAAHGQEVDA